MHLKRKEIKVAMAYRDYTQKLLAERSGVSRGTINAICCGRSCSEQTAQKIAAALGVTLKDLTDTEQ